jgi:site-specific DNA-methyltransferase (adenine-specific)
MGVGSTGIACIKTNRRFIGIELEEEYFNIATGLIQKEKDSQTPPPPTNLEQSNI